LRTDVVKCAVTATVPAITPNVPVAGIAAAAATAPTTATATARIPLTVHTPKQWVDFTLVSFGGLFGDGLPRIISLAIAVLGSLLLTNALLRTSRKLR
jgi:hypothetical protein